jgi:uncharacterized protein
VTNAQIYEVTISHARSAPLRNVFRYRSYLWLVDPDRLPRIPLLTVFRGRDHLGDPRRGIRENLDRFLAANGISRPHTITMLTQARVLGYVFNPLTVYWCHRPDCVVAEVHNTYGQRYAYLLCPDPQGRATAAKNFYVSPFLPVAGAYRMRLPEPAGTLHLGVTLDLTGQSVLAATVTGRRHAYTPGRLLGLALRHPWVTAQVSALIRWQGVRLIARGHPMLRRPHHHPQEGVQ